MTILQVASALAGKAPSALNRFHLSCRSRAIRNMRKSIVLLFLILAGCSSSSETRDTGLPTAKQAARVVVVETVPENVGRFSNLSATLCRGSGPMAPSRSNALLLLKMRAYQNGYLTLHSVTVDAVSGSMAEHCSGGVQARGIGYSLP